MNKLQAARVVMAKNEIKAESSMASCVYSEIYECTSAITTSNISGRDILWSELI